MTKIALILLFTSLLFSCSHKQKSKGAFKLFVGDLTTPLDGGAFVAASEITTNINTLYKLDSTQSILIPYGTYKLILVTFLGPLANSGTMMCGSLENATFNAQDTLLEISISSNECSLPKYSTTILSLKKDIVSIWESDRWDLSNWGH